jgi:hypothetical protein
MVHSKERCERKEAAAAVAGGREDAGASGAVDELAGSSVRAEEAAGGAVEEKKRENEVDSGGCSRLLGNGEGKGGG